MTDDRNLSHFSSGENCTEFSWGTREKWGFKKKLPQLGNQAKRRICPIGACWSIV
jgi:hypothetical protein